MEQQTYEVGGFAFTDEALAGQAKKELEAVKYLQLQTDREKPEMMLAVYHQMIEEDMFKTPVGMCYLKEMQDCLRANPKILNGDISDIPVHKQQKQVLVVKKEAAPKEKKRTEVVRKEKNVNYKSRYRMLLTLSVALTVIVLAMFGITLTSNSPNILNYENKLINKYENWEQRLVEKEKELDAREDALEGNVQDTD